MATGNLERRKMHKTLRLSSDSVNEKRKKKNRKKEQRKTRKQKGPAMLGQMDGR